MAVHTKGQGALIRTGEGTLVEINVPSDMPAIFDARLARPVSFSLYSLNKIVGDIYRSVVSSIEDAQINASQVEIEFGVAFESEGNIYVTKSRDESNINIKITLGSEDLRITNR